jgi:hypothetical protein
MTMSAPRPDFHPEFQQILLWWIPRPGSSRKNGWRIRGGGEVLSRSGGCGASVGWSGNSHRERNGALLRVHAVLCSELLDTADIVRDPILRQQMSTVADLLCVAVGSFGPFCACDWNHSHQPSNCLTFLDILKLDIGFPMSSDSGRPRLQTSNLQPWFAIMSGVQRALVGVAVGAFLFVSGGALDWFVTRQYLPRISLMLGGPQWPWR